MSMSDPGRAITIATGEPAPNLREMVSAELSRQASGGFASTTASAGYGLARRLPLAQRSILASKVARLEGRLFDEDGRLRQDLGDEVAGTLLGEINELRHDLGWLSVDRRHHHMWPTDLVC
jgi:hypothetical protein